MKKSLVIAAKICVALVGLSYIAAYFLGKNGMLGIGIALFSISFIPCIVVLLRSKCPYCDSHVAIFLFDRAHRKNEPFYCTRCGRKIEME